MKDRIIHFQTVSDLQVSLAKYLETVKQQYSVKSELVGDKMRSDVTSDQAEMDDIKEKMQDSKDKKKKEVKKKDKKTNWHDMGPIAVYDGVGSKGENEMHFAELEMLKVQVEQLEKIKEALDDMVAKGIKKELGCSVMLNRDHKLQIAFMKVEQPKAKYTFKGTLEVPAEMTYAVTR